MDKEKLPYYNTPDFTPLWIENISDNTAHIHTIHDFSFTDQNGNIVTQKDIAGKIHVANFFFTSCSGICPMMQQNFELLQDTFMHDENIVLLSYSVTPWADSVPKLHMYAQMHDVNILKWHLLTGDKKDIYDLARQSYFVEETTGYSADTSQFLHTEHCILVDKHNYIRGIYNGTLILEIQRLIHDIELLEKEET